MERIEFIRQSHEILGIFHSDGYTEPHDFVATAARTCYKSKATDSGADERLVRSLVKNGHHAMLEHSFISVRFVTDRAIANEIVRHRHFSFAQESTRYVNYDKRGFRFVIPEGLDDVEQYEVARTCERCVDAYENMARWTDPQTARAVLPLCTATEIVVSGNVREWRHMLELRTAPDAHPQIRALMSPLLAELKERVPVLFDDLDAS